MFQKAADFVAVVAAHAVEATLILKLVIGVCAVISAAGMVWLVVDDIRFKFRTRDHRWATWAAVRITAVLIGPPLTVSLVAVVLARSGFHTVTGIGLRLVGAAILSFWAVALGSAAQNRLFVAVSAYPGLVWFERMERWSEKYLATWWATRVILASAAAFLFPGLAMSLPIILLNIRNQTPVLRAFLRLEPRPGLKAPFS